MASNRVSRCGLAVPWMRRESSCMVRDRFGASAMVQVESPGAGAGAGADSARSGGCNGIRLDEVMMAGDGWATWGRAGPDSGPG